MPTPPEVRRDILHQLRRRTSGPIPSSRRRVSSLGAAETLLFTAAVFVASPTPAATQGVSGEFLPTPYSAEQIRDAWSEGFWLDTRTTTAEGSRVGRTVVTAWSAEGCEMVEQPVAEDGSLGPASPVYRAAWTELRDHAKFPAQRARRERVRRSTPLGQLDGWLYTVDQPPAEDGSPMVRELFFPDALPGAPVFFRELRGDEEAFRAEQIARRGIDGDISGGD
ncbi:MAG: hypothetical protein DWQ36_03315 [Acidobacteria bacterium]|nr:MAG: hypothetical protein DWQ30_23025 [Acidobacteriota bacterium]REK10728.1 MAG: hypothetical protein DWQ36_03315 [Acidobacteriota bacterium]